MLIQLFNDNEVPVNVFDLDGKFIINYESKAQCVKKLLLRNSSLQRNGKGGPLKTGRKAFSRMLNKYVIIKMASNG